MDNANPETTLEELIRVREELQGTRIALIALCNADDAFRASFKTMMRSPLGKALEESSNNRYLEQMREVAVTLCVELGRSLKDHLE